MPTELRVRRRARLRNKEVAALASRIFETFGVTIDEALALDAGDYDKIKVYISGGRIVAFDHDGRVVPSLRFILGSPPKSKHVTVDMGAVKFLCNGADIMAPGIVDADRSIAPGDLVWVREEKHSKPLAIGIALVGGPGMVRGKGKAVQSLHYIGDSLWEFED
ncbi:MAG: PUA domain-containing protein [Methanobacteriota archaeon]